MIIIIRQLSIATLRIRRSSDSTDSVTIFWYILYMVCCDTRYLARDSPHLRHSLAPANPERRANPGLRPQGQHSRRHLDTWKGSNRWLRPSIIGDATPSVRLQIIQII